MNKYIVTLILFPLVLGSTAACALDRLEAKSSSTVDTLANHKAAEPLVRSVFVKTQVAFAPWDDVEGMIVKALDKAREQILVQAYVLSNKKIVAALIRAHARKVDVRVLVDYTQMQERVTRVAELVQADIPVRLEMRYHSAHNKLIVIDPARTSDATVITGSMNYSDTSPHKNAENVLIISGTSDLARDYARNWHRHAQQAVPYTAACHRQKSLCAASPA